jgi:hypothetical protein
MRDVAPGAAARRLSPGGGSQGEKGQNQENERGFDGHERLLPSLNSRGGSRINRRRAEIEIMVDSTP